MGAILLGSAGNVPENESTNSIPIPESLPIDPTVLTDGIGIGVGVPISTGETTQLQLIIPPSTPMVEAIELPDTIPTQELVGVDAIAPAGTVVELPITVPSVQLVGMDTITPVGDVV